MNKRFGFIAILSVVALGATGCDGEPEADAGCTDGSICITDRDGGGDDDAATPDGGPPVDRCGASGRIAGPCRGGTTCLTGLTCAPSITRNMSGSQLTLGDIGYNSGTEDPDNPGEYLSGAPSNVPINFTPNTQCSQECDPGAMDDGCGMCATCTTRLGPGGAVSAFNVALSVGVTENSNFGMCRLNCVFDPETRGGCPDGYTCDPSSNICIEACVSDSQCNSGFGVSRHDGVVITDNPDMPFMCNTTTGRCEWTPPSGAGFGSECESNADCPEDIGVCLVGGRCATYQCNLPDATGMAARYPCPESSICVGFGGNDSAACLGLCNEPADCHPGLACSELSMPAPDGSTGICFGICEADSECHADERCQIGGFQNPDVGTCQSYCDPTGEDPMAVTCEEDEICEPVEGQSYGFCAAQDQLCFADDDCNGQQACEVLADDLFGRCVDGCTSAADCAGGELCRIQPEQTVGVCRAPGAMCAPSPMRMDGSIIQPLRGDAQCAPGQTCSSSDPNTVGTCMGELPDGGVMPMPDGGVGDGGVGDGGVVDGGGAGDAGTAEDAGVDGGTTLLPDGAVVLPDAAI